MENKSVQRKSSADARIVQAVRRLKSTRQKENLVEVRKNQEEQKNQKLILRKSININNNNQENNSNKNASTILHPIISKKNSFIINNSNDNLININEHNNIINNHRRINQSNTLIPRKSINISKNNHSNKRISIDGGLGKPGTSSTNKSQNKTFDYETLKKYKKRKLSEYQKNLLSKKNLDKYKEEFISLINKDIQIKTLLDKIGINNDDKYLNYITDNFFEKPHFLFTLEILILEAVEEANTLRVFRTNKNVLPLKVIKENYFRDEIFKSLKLQIYEDEYENKYNNLMKNVDDFIDKLKLNEL
jgi:hypothetical protein